MPPKKRTATTTTTTAVTDAQLKVLIARGVANALAEDEANRTSRNGDDSHDSGTSSRRTERAACEYNYSDFLKCQPLNFKGTEGVVGLTQWFEKMESTVGHDVAYAMTWKALKRMMTDEYCPRGEIKKLEIKLWNLKESDEIEKYVGGLPDMIHGSAMASKPKKMQDAIEFATELMDKKISTLAERQAENKRKLDNNNQAQQQPPKKQGVAIAYTARSSERKEYAGTLPILLLQTNRETSHCYECGHQGHYMSDCPELKNQNHRDQAGGIGARRMVHALGGGETNQDLNNMENDINA
ncbi:reverse transcriptase domain-containing protein [Tanacetum coccineum]